MKNLKSTFTLVLLVTLTTISYAGNNDKVVEKAREIVNNAAPDDYLAYANAAEICIRKDVNLTEAKEWFEKSILIKENSKAYEVAGDYYANNNLKEKAIESYVKSMLLAKQENFNADTAPLETKIARVKRK